LLAEARTPLPQQGKYMWRGLKLKKCLIKEI